MAVAYRSSGTIVANGDAGVDMSANQPSGLAIDDIMIFVGMDADNENFDAAMPVGWAVLQSRNASANMGFTVAWKRYDGTETDWQFDTPSNAGSLVCGVLHAYSGCIISGNPFQHSADNGVNNSTGWSNSYAGATGHLKGSVRLIEDDVAVNDGSAADWSLDDNQTTTVGSDGRLAVFHSTSVSSTLVNLTTGTNEYNSYVHFRLIPETHRPTIVPNTADANDFGADDTPSVEFTGSDANSDTLEYEFEILSAIDTDVDKYIESNQDATLNIPQATSTMSGLGQSFTGNGDYLTQSKFYIKKTGSPTGYVYAKLYAHTGAFGTNGTPTGIALSTSIPLDISTLTTSYVLTTFDFNGIYQMVNTTKYFIAIEYYQGDASNTLDVGFDNSSSTHAGNSADLDGTWNLYSTKDITFYVLGSTRELNKLSVTPDATFTNTVDSLDGHPFVQADKVDFTVGYETIVSHNETNGTSNIAIGNATVIARGQSFTGNGDDINGVTFLHYKVGSPTGNVVAKLYAHSGTFGTSSVPTGTALATSDGIDITTIRTTPVRPYVFNFPTPYTTVNGTKYVIVVEYDGDGSNYLAVRYEATTPSHEGNSSDYDGSWVSAAGDLIFYIHKAESLADSTWYWRARAIDPLGTNQYSDWTTIRSFLTGASGTISGTISANSVVTANLKGKGALKGIINASSTVSANLISFADISGTINANSVVTSNLTAKGQVKGVINSGSTMTCSITAVGIMKGTINCSSTVTTNIMGFGYMSATINCSSSVGCNLSAQPSTISGTINGVSTVSTILVGKGVVQATINANSGVTAKLFARGDVVGTINTSSIVTCNIINVGFSPISGTVSASSTVTCNIVAVGNLKAVVNANSVVTAILVGKGVLKGTINASSTVTCNLLGKKFASGTVNTSSTVTASIIAKGSLKAVINGNSVVTANLVGTGLMSATINASSTVTCNLIIKPTPISGTINTNSVVTANITAKGSLKAVINANSVVTCNLISAITDQTARPDNDDTIGSWTDEVGGTTNIYLGISEIVAEDVEYVRSEDDPASSAYISGLSTLTDPVSSANHIIKYRYAKGESGGGSPGVIDITIELRQGTTVIGSQTHNGATTTVTDGTFTLTGTEADSITDYTNLNFRLLANKSSGTRTSWGVVTWIELKVPLAPDVSAISGTVNGNSAVTCNIVAKGSVKGIVNASSTVTVSLIAKGDIIGTVNASSVVTANIVAKGVVKGIINTSSTVTTNLIGSGALKGTVSANSIVTANLVGKGVLKGVINTSSTVTCNLINVGVSAISGTVNASSVVSAILVAKGDIIGTVNASSVVTANLIGKGNLKGIVNASSTVTASIIGTGLISATISANSLVTANLTAVGTLKGTINASSTVTCNLINIGVSAISGTVNASSTVTANLIAKGSILATINTSSTITTNLVGKGLISATATPNSSVTANLLAKGSLKVVIDGVSTVTASLIANGLLQGTINASSTVTCSLVNVGTSLISGTVDGNSLVTANLVGKGFLKGAINTSSTVTCNLINVGVSDIGGTVNASSTVTGNIVGKGTLKGVINTLSNVTANLLGKAVLKGVISTASNVTASLLGKAVLKGTVNASSVVTANLIALTNLSGTINGSSTVTANIIGKGLISCTINTSSTVTCNLIDPDSSPNLETIYKNSYITTEESFNQCYTVEVTKKSHIK